MSNKVIPVLTGATGTISKSLRKYLSNIPGKHKMKEFGTARILRGNANVKVRKCLPWDKPLQNVCNTTYCTNTGFVSGILLLFFQWHNSPAREWVAWLFRFPGYTQLDTNTNTHTHTNTNTHTHTHTHTHTVGLLWKSDQLVVEATT